MSQLRSVNVLLLLLLLLLLFPKRFELQSCISSAEVCPLSRVHTKLTKQKQNRNSVFCDKSATILQHL